MAMKISKTNKIKPKRLSKGKRMHVRRQKQEARETVGLTKA